MRQLTAHLLLAVLLATLMAPVYAHAVGTEGHACSDQLCTCPPDCPHHRSGHGGHDAPKPSAAMQMAHHGSEPAEQMGDCESRGECHLATPQVPGHPLTIKALPRTTAIVPGSGPGGEPYARLKRQLLRTDPPPTEPPRA